MRVCILILCLTLPTISASAQQADFVDSLDGDLVLNRPLPAAALVAPSAMPVPVDLPVTEPLPQLDASNADPRLRSEQIGYVRPFPSEILPVWPWQLHDDGGWVARVELHSNNALGLRLKFSNLTPTSSVQLRVYDPAGTAVLKPRPQSSGDESGWWAPTIFGDTIGLELYLPPDADWPIDEPKISDVAYIPCRCHGGPPSGNPLSCNNHVACFPSWQNNEARGVAFLFFIPASGGCTKCTGGLLNRQPGDRSPLLMTANHCISTQSEANSVEVFWKWEWDTCTNPTLPVFNNLPRNNGARLLKRHSDSDWTLLGLYDPPAAGANELYLGWNANSWSNNEDATGVHHPRGLHKRISFGDTGGTSNRTFCDANGQNCVDVDVRKVTWSDGVTEPGSSGSPVFDADRFMRGTLTGGNSTCPSGTGDAFYGRFDLAYDNLRYFMGDSYIAGPVYVDGAVAGDPGNNGSSEQGSFALPFNTIHEATYAVRSGDDVRIQPGNYNQQFRIWRPMTLKRAGSSGTARIGD